MKTGELVFLRNQAHSDATNDTIRTMLRLYIGPYVCSKKIKETVVEVVEPKTGRITARQSVERCKIWRPAPDIFQQCMTIVKESVPEEVYQYIIEGQS